MTMTVSTWLALITMLLGACVSVPQGSPASPIPTTGGGWPRPSPATPSPPELPSYTGCFYAWATRELPALTEKIQKEFARLDGGIRASAYAFGEECRRDDGSVSFLPMETDFRVRIPVTTLADDAALGAWISRAMSVVDALPVSEVAGTRPGRVEFEFYVDESNRMRLAAEISRYRSEAGGLDNASILGLFREGP